MTFRNTISFLLSDQERLEHFISSMKLGEVAALPTDTLYGLAVDADSISGVSAIYQMKCRGETKPLILFIDRIEKLEELGIKPNLEQFEFLKPHWPGPLTAIFPIRNRLFRGFSSSSIGVRIPSYSPLLSLLSAYPGYFLTTSANISGEPPIRNPDQIESTFKNRLGWILDGGVLPVSEPSTVVDMNEFPPKVLREGKIKKTALFPK
ncbi:threonylcarbamoyl-AMP synthase [bacterium]|nr:threonylcarbamoyl-AMP synthase [bacterium]